MLSYDSLVLHSKERGMPPAKLRGAVREYLQVLTLKALYGLPGNLSKGLVFLGGTALRLGYELARFSEDLDFDVKDLLYKDWRVILEDTGHALSQQGFSVELKTMEKGTLLLGDLRCKGFLQAYGLSDESTEKLKIKMEANRPEYLLGTEPKVVTGYGEMFPVPFAAPDLFAAEKILALLNRELGRDVYDLFFIAGKKWKPDVRVLSSRGITGNPVKAILERINKWGPKSLASMARRLEPFLFEPEQAKMVAQASTLLPAAITYMME